MMCHIATTDSLFQYPELSFHGECHFCGKVCLQETSYIGLRCTNCKIMLDGEQTMGDLCLIMREKIGLNRPKFSKIIGYSKKTIKTYEFGYATQKYFDKVIHEFRNYLIKKEQNEN